MKTSRSWHRLLLLHPLAFSISPVLTLFTENYGELHPELTVRSFIIVSATTLLLLAILTLLLRDGHRAAAIVAVSSILFFSYGHLYASLEPIHVLGIQLGRHRHLFLVYGLAWLGTSWLVLSRVRLRFTLTRVLSVAGLSMLLMSLGLLGSKIIRSSARWAQPTSQASGGQLLSTSEGLGKSPDIYYIILDGYARSDVMLARHGMDNQDFLQTLEKSGFFVADQSSANFVYTALSLASSLNMRFIPDLGIPLPFGSYPALFAEPIQHNLVRFELEKLGYETVALESGWLPTEVEDADYYLRAVGPDDRRFHQGSRLNMFETLLANSSGGLVILDALGTERLSGWFHPRGGESHEVLRTIVLESFENLEASVELPSPKFVFAHIVSPHSPYLFGRDGEYLYPEGQFTLLAESDASGSTSESVLYRDQAEYITARIAATMDIILENSNEPPVVILQADHGPGIGPDWRLPDGETLWQRLAILNAYHLPYGCDRRLYSTITPVNTFRVVLSCYFGLNYPLLEDKSFFSYWPEDYAYAFIEVDVSELQHNYPLTP
jgi:hypothetical protein